MTLFKWHAQEAEAQVCSEKRWRFNMRYVNLIHWFRYVIHRKWNAATEKQVYDILSPAEYYTTW